MQKQATHRKSDFTVLTSKLFLIDKMMLEKNVTGFKISNNSGSNPVETCIFAIC